jgi:hypothetical protein
VTIKELSATALVIGHAGGTGRIAVADLPAEFRERYQLDVIEAARIAKAERERRTEEEGRRAEERELAKLRAEEERSQLEEVARRKGKPTPDEEGALAAEKEAIAELKREVDALYSELQAQESIAREARSRMGGRDRSPAGSLETWEDRYRRVSAIAQKTNLRLRLKESDLMALDPRYKPRKDLSSR